jgi:hypothetical protein
MAVLKILCLLTMCGCNELLTDKGQSDQAVLQLAASNRTDYAVVKPGKATEVDWYAVSTLTNFLFQKTGAVFPVVAPGQATPAGKYIFVGLSGPALKLADKDPLASLKDQEYVVRSDGADILLYGKGLHGNLYAVMDFMENTLGRRWYTDGLHYGVAASQREPGEGEPVFTVERNLAVRPFERKGGFAFAYRQLTDPRLFQYQHGLNMGFSERKKMFKKTNPDFFPDGVESKAFIAPGTGHTLFSYIPPDPNAPGANAFDWLKTKDYFASHPDFFSMNQAGTRVANQQLCFSNPALRKEFTQNVLEHIRIFKDRERHPLIVGISAMDLWTGDFCFCKGCQALRQKYGTPGGPIFDYLFELCAVVKARHPDTLIQTLAYRLSQTQKPPVMPAGQAFPDNLIVQFANIQDDVDKDWNHPHNRPSYEDLLAWGKLTPHLWTWYYPNSYAAGGSMPTGNNIERMVTDLRLMHKAGVQGVYIEQGSFAVPGGFNFTELQKYIYVQLFKDINRDVAAVIREFTDYQYGAAAALARTYLQELEAGQKAASGDTSFGAGRTINRVMTGLTPPMLWRWQGYFDRMESDTAADVLRLKNVRRLRQTLDYATLTHWNDLSKAYPETFSDYRVVKARLAPTPPPWGLEALVEEWEMMIQVAGTEKPLPAPFDAMDKTLVRRFVPHRSGWHAPVNVKDPNAAFGFAAVVDKPDKPFHFGFYQSDTKTRGRTGKVESDDIELGRYRLYELGEIQVTQDCIVWFSGRSWLTQLQLGERLYGPTTPDNDNRYDVHVSLKFDPPVPPATNDPYSAFCDQVIFVRKPVK